MLTVTVRLLHGWLRAGSASEAALTGYSDPGEWPPSPARLFSAFVAADGTGSRCRVTNGSELRLLETADPPVIHADPDVDVLRAPLRERFVVDDQRAKNTMQDYPARQATLVRPGTRLLPRDPRVVYRFTGLDPVEEHLRALQLRAARIGYLGAADAPAQVTVARESGGELPPAWEADPTGVAVLDVPFDGLLAALDDAFERFSGGETVERGWLPRRAVRYRAPDQAAPEPDAGETLWLQFQPPVSGHLALAVTETLREAVLAHHPAGAGAPPIVHGHGFTGSGWEQVRYLPLVEVGHAFASGRVHGAAVWLPPSASEEERAGVRSAVLSIRRLVRRSAFDLQVSLHDGSPRPWAANPTRWMGPARRWVSATPVVHERHGPVDDAEMARWCEHAGLPTPVRWRVSRTPLTVGGAQPRPDALRRRYGPSPFSHVAVEFAAPVGGPIALGKGRQFGLGLLAPEARADG